MPTFVPLGSAAGFAVLAGSGITIAGAVNSSNITGNIGTFPTTTETGLGNLVLSGINHAGDTITQTAKNDLVTAYNAAAGQIVTQTVPTELGSTTKGPGVYDSTAGTFTITGTLTLDGGGDPNAVFIFKAASTLITAASSNVVLIGGAQACNVFWQIGSSATLGASSNLLGTVLAMTSITATTSATATGRLLARNGAVTFDNNSLALCSLAGSGGVVRPISIILQNELRSSAACFLEPCMSEAEREAVHILLGVKSLAALGGPDYSNPTTLQQAASGFNRLSKNERRAMALAINLQNAIEDGAVLPSGTGINGLKKDSRCFLCIPRQIRLDVLLFLKWKLNALDEPS